MIYKGYQVTFDHQDANNVYRVGVGNYVHRWPTFVSAAMFIRCLTV